MVATKYVTITRPNEPDLSKKVRFGIYCTPPNSAMEPLGIVTYRSQLLDIAEYRASDRRLIVNLGKFFKSNELPFSRTVAADTVGQLHGRRLGPCGVNSGSSYRRSLTGYCALDLLSESLV